LASDRAHRRLADYFTPRNGPVSGRQVEEWPWQLAALRDWPALAAALTTPEVLPGAWSSGPFEVKSFWALIAAESSIEPASAYRDVVESPADFPDAYVRTVALLLNDLGKATAAGPIVDHLVSRARTTSDPLALQAALALRAQAMKLRGDLGGALASLLEQEEACRQADDTSALAAALEGQGLIHRDLRNTTRALEAFLAEESLCSSSGDLAGLAASLGNQGIIWFDQGDIERALGLFQRQEKLCRRLGDLAMLHRCLGNQAAALRTRGRFDQALKLHAEEERICRQLGDIAGLASSLGNQAVVLMELADFDAAWELLEQKEQICGEIGDTSGLIKAKFLKAYLLGSRMGLADDARPPAEEALRLAEAAGLDRQATEIMALLRTLERQQPGNDG
jgi:tetratricopeptide (TPR) repeat protein